MATIQCNIVYREKNMFEMISKLSTGITLMEYPDWFIFEFHSGALAKMYTGSNNKTIIVCTV